MKIAVSLAAILLLALAPAVWYFSTKEARQKTQVLAQEAVASPSPTTEVTPSPSPTPTLTPSPTPKPTLPPAPAVPVYTAAQIDEFFAQYSTLYNVDIWLLRNIAVCESGYQSQARNLYYQGMYQFSESTWKANRLVMGEDPNPVLRNDAGEAIQTAAYLISQGKGPGLWPNCYSQ